MKNKFLYTRSDNIIWFLTPKTGTRSMHRYFSEHKLNFPAETDLSIPNDHANCFKFAFSRNPWGRLVSTYNDKVRLQWENENFANSPNIKYRIKFYKQFKGGSFKEFIKWIGLNGDHYERHIKQQTSLIPYDIVDFIGKFENLQEDFNILCEKIGIPKQQLPHQNKTKYKHYTEYYDDETKQIVAEKYAKDIEYFGYEFGK